MRPGLLLFLFMKDEYTNVIIKYDIILFLLVRNV